MKYDPQRHHRRSIRLKGYDYTQVGAYFVTLVAKNRECLFGEITAEGEMRLNDAGQIAAEEWERTPTIRAEIELDAWVVMPNHVHGIIVINNANAVVVGADGRPPLPDPTGRPPLPDPTGHPPLPDPTGRPPLPDPTGRPPLQPQRAPKSLGAFVAGYKSVVTKRINEIRAMPGVPVWQRNYHEHILRNEDELHRIRQYIANNPLKWALDEENPRKAGRPAAPTP